MKRFIPQGFERFLACLCLLLPVMLSCATGTDVVPPPTSPIVGTWREAAQIECGSGREVPPDEPIQELRFFADGKVDVTWMPFETYVDYWGTYRLAEDGSIELDITGGNYVPEDIDGQGRYVLDQEGQLILEELWLGSPMVGAQTVNCGHRFTE